MLLFLCFEINLKSIYFSLFPLLPSWIKIPSSLGWIISVASWLVLLHLLLPPLNQFFSLQCKLLKNVDLVMLFPLSNGHVISPFSGLPLLLVSKSESWLWLLGPSVIWLLISLASCTVLLPFAVSAPFISPFQVFRHALPSLTTVSLDIVFLQFRTIFFT